MSAYRRKNPWLDYLPPDPSHNRSAPELTPVFGVKTFDATTTCADIHPHGPIPTGSRCVCMGPCHKSGVEARVREHVKPGNGQVRDGWADGSGSAQPTSYVPPATTATAKGGKPLRGGTGR